MTAIHDAAAFLMQAFPALQTPVPLPDAPPTMRASEARRARAYRYLERKPLKERQRFWRRLWEDLARQGCPIREPVQDMGSLIPLQLVGACLEPIIPVGATCWIDPNARAQPGDFVVVRMDDALLDALARHPVALRENGGPPRSNVFVKRLTWLAGGWFLVSKNSGGPIGNKAPHRHKVLGVVRGITLPSGTGPAPACGAYMDIMPRDGDVKGPGFVDMPQFVLHSAVGTLPQTARLVWTTDGFIKDADGDVLAKWWSNAPDPGAGTEYQVRLESTLAGTWEQLAAAEGEWITISSDRAYGVQRTAMQGSGTDVADGIFQIRAAGAGAILDECVGSVDAGDQ